MQKGPIGFVIMCFALWGVLFGCSATESGKSAARNRYPDRYVQRTVTDYQGQPFLRITCEYIGRQPYKGYQTGAPWQTKNIDFYNIGFENLSRHKITFISKKVYQKDARHDSAETGSTGLVLIEFADFMEKPDSDFDNLEPFEERKLINWAFEVNEQRSDNIASFVLQIHHQGHEYTFNIHLADTR